jgi:hypothetical protein
MELLSTSITDCTKGNRTIYGEYKKRVPARTDFPSKPSMLNIVTAKIIN